MKTLTKSLAALALAAPASLSPASFTYTSGTQTNHGLVRNFVATPTTLSYDHAAPDPLASWFDPESLALDSPSGMSSVSIETTYSSTVLPEQISCLLHLHGNSGSRSGQTSAEVLQVFSLAFVVDAPMPVDISASLFNVGPFPGDPVSLVFGRDGDAPIINFSTEAGSASFPLQSMVLQPGNYSLVATHEVHLSSGAIGVTWNSEIAFDMVPAPAAAAPLLLGLSLLRRRR